MQMIYRKCCLILIAVSLPLLAPSLATPSNAAGRSFEECQAYAISLGIPASRTGKVNARYLRYQAAGTAMHPQGIIARCMAGTR
jgi:hypothetical protein